jgi:cell wall-associated NlpC family hydrolase
VTSREAEAAARLLERLLGDPAYRRRFRENPVATSREAGLDSVAEEMAMRTGKAMETLDDRESRSSLAGVFMAAALEGAGVYDFSHDLVGHLDGIPEQVEQVLSRGAPASPNAAGEFTAITPDQVAAAHEHVAAAAPPVEPLDPDQYGQAGGGGHAPREALALLGDKRVTFDADGVADLKAGRIDPRIVSMLSTITREHRVTISAVSSDHPKLTTGGSVSNHYYGRAVDIASIDGKPVGPENSAARELAMSLSKLDPSIRPSEIGSPWALPGAAYFTDSGHQDHIHVAFDDPVASSWKHPEDVAAPEPAPAADASPAPDSPSEEPSAPGPPSDEPSAPAPPSDEPSARAPAAGEAPAADDGDGAAASEPGGLEDPGGDTDAQADDESDGNEEDDDSDSDDEDEEDEDEEDEVGEAPDADDLQSDGGGSDGDHDDNSDQGSGDTDDSDSSDGGGNSDSGDSSDSGASDDSRTDGGDDSDSADASGPQVDVDNAPTSAPADDAPQTEIAAWMGAQAEKRGLPRELPIMAGLVESGLSNADHGDRDSLGYFQMRRSIWDQGDYAGYPDRPDLQLKWFLDHAEAVKQERAAAGKPVDDPGSYGDWVADVERPAEQYRGRYQLRLEDARNLLQQGANAEPPVEGDAPGADPGPRALAALAEAKKYMGTPYKWGGSTPQTGFDCSGLVQWAYAKSGITIPRTSEQQILATNGTSVDRGHLRPGDLVFFRNASGDVHHVGISLGGDKFINAPHTGARVRVNSLDEPYYAQEFAGGRRFDAASHAPEPRAPGVDPDAVQKAEESLARDAAEAQRPGTLLFQAVQAQEQLKLKETQLLQAVQPGS